MAELLDEIENLAIIEGAAEDLLLDNAGRVAGLMLGDGRRITAGRVGCNLWFTDPANSKVGRVAP